MRTVEWGHVAMGEKLREDIERREVLYGTVAFSLEALVKMTARFHPDDSEIHEAHTCGCGRRHLTGR